MNKVIYFKMRGIHLCTDVLYNDCWPGEECDDRTAARSRGHVRSIFLLGRNLSSSIFSIPVLSDVLGKSSETMSDTQLNTVAEFCLSGVPTETCRQLCWYVLVDTLPK
jgi:hypothetical protein